MDAELFVHGPRHAFYGKQEEAAYSTLFDDSSITDEVRFIVEIRKGNDNKLYTYYSYCRYGNVTDIDGRSGAYLGITLRLDVYYTNLRAIYTILDATFYRGVVELLVKKVPTGFQYIVSNFESTTPLILEKIEKPLGILLGNIISISDVVSIDNSFKLAGKAYLHGIDDTQAKECRLSEMRTTGKIVFASSSPIEQLQTIIDQCNRDKQAYAESKREEIDDLKSNILSITTKASETTNKLIAAETENKRLNSENSVLRQEITSFKEERDSIRALKEEKGGLAKSLQETEYKVSNLGRQLEKAQIELKRSQSLKEELALSNKENNELRKQIYALTKEIKSLKRGFTQSDSKGEMSNKFAKEFPKSCNTLRLALPQSTDTDREATLENPNPLQEEDKTERVFYFYIKKYRLPVISFFCGALLFGIIGYFIGLGIAKSFDRNGEEAPLETVLPYKRDASLFPDETKITEYMKISPPEFKTGKNIDVLIHPEEDIQDATWQIIGPCKIARASSQLIRFIPYSKGEYTISYVRNDTIVLQRKIVVRK